jgi:hypothetical protein
MTDPQPTDTDTDDVEGHGPWMAGVADDPDTDDVAGHGRVRLRDQDDAGEAEGHTLCGRT